MGDLEMDWFQPFCSVYLADCSLTHSLLPERQVLHRLGSHLQMGAGDLGFESRLRWDFSRLSHTSVLKIGTPVATVPDAWHYRVSTGTGQLVVSIL